MIVKQISPNQPAFHNGKLLFDEVVHVNEVIYLTRNTKKACLIYKVDFKKVYDSVRWILRLYAYQIWL